MQYQILLDTSIFHNGSFEELKNSSFQKYCANGVFSFHPTVILIEEILTLFWKNKKIDKAKEYLKFIIETGKGRWFREIFEIWRLELEGDVLGTEYYFLEERKEKRIKESIEKKLRQNGFFNSREILEVNGLKQTEFLKKKKSKEIGNEMRNYIARESKKQGLNRHHTDFSSVFKMTVDSFAKSIIEKKVNTAFDKNVLFNKWKEKKANFPYFTDWLKSFLYIYWYAMTEPNEPLDKNAEGDIRHLFFLRDTDIIVSNDNKFMRKAFYELFGGRKKYLSLEEFIIFINELNLS